MIANDSLDSHFMGVALMNEIVELGLWNIEM